MGKFGAMQTKLGPIWGSVQTASRECVRSGIPEAMLTNAAQQGEIQMHTA